MDRSVRPLISQFFFKANRIVVFIILQDGCGCASLGLNLEPNASEVVSWNQTRTETELKSEFNLEVQTDQKYCNSQRQECEPSGDSWWTWWLWLRFPLTGSKKANKAVTDVWTTAAHFS